MSLDGAPSTTIDLSGPWRLTDAAGEYETVMQVPGDGISALHRAGLIPDPYWGRNEYDLRWIADREWVIEREFQLTDTAAQLVLSGLDCAVTVAVNGAVVLESSNAFRRFAIDLDAVAVLGRNTLRITFHSAIEVGRQRAEAQPFQVPSMNDHLENASQCPIPYGNMLRKVACDYGWDWNIALCPFGLLGEVLVRPVARVSFEAIQVSQTHSQSDVKVNVEGSVQGGGAGTPVSVILCGAEVDTTTDTSGYFSATLTIPNPDLWWPNTLGPQPLHDLTIRADQTVWHRRIGLCDIRLITEADEVGCSFVFQVNGHRHFARGANWIPADALAGNITREGVRDLLQSAVDANMTMIRVWGGGRYEPDWFYDLCDELGLMVWQDAMFSCNLYPSTDDFLQDVALEVAEQAQRLAHHPCLALWCGDNELVGALGWFPESRQNRDRYLASYDRLNRTVEQAVKAGDPGANWWPSSPSRGRLDFGDGWHDDTSGDMHFWSVWHEGRDFDHYRDVAPRFCSEFGFQSYPSMDVVRRFCPPEEQNIASPVMESHQKNAGGNARIAETMFRYFRFPEGFGNFVYLSQVQQAEAIRTAVTHWRSLKPRCMGTLYWQLNDTWPCASWSSLDHGGGWKLLHHAAREFFAPVMVCAVPVDDRIEVRAVNDTLSDVTLTVEVFALSLDGTQTRLGADELRVPPDRAVVAPTEYRRPTDALLMLRWTGPDGAKTEVFAPRPWKSYALPDPGLSLTRDGDTATLIAERPAFFVALEGDAPMRPSAGGVHVLPGHPVEITGISAPTVTTRDLHSATYGKTP